MKIPFMTLMVVLVGQNGAAELSFAEQPIALPRLSLSVQVTASRQRDESVPKEIERLANTEFQRRFGLCGMIHFVERFGDAWTFSTKIGYAGLPGPDLTVFSPIKGSEEKKPNQAPEPTAPSGRGSS